MLSNASVLVSPNCDGRSFIIMPDAADYGIGCCYAKYDDAGVESPVMFLSRELSKAEAGPDISRKDGLGVTWAARKLKCLLHGSPTIIITDHSSLTHLMTNRHLVSAQQRGCAMDLIAIPPLGIVRRTAGNAAPTRHVVKPGGGCTGRCGKHARMDAGEPRHDCKAYLDSRGSWSRGEGTVGAMAKGDSISSGWYSLTGKGRWPG